MEMANIVNQMIILFIITAIGFFAGKIRILDERSNKILSSLVMNITLPATVLDSVLNEDVAITGGDAAWFLLMVTCAYVIMILIAAIVPKLLRVPPEDAGVYRFVTVFSNTGFMGYPVTAAIFGAASALYVSLIGLVFNLLAFSVGAAYIRGSRGEIDFRAMLSPALISTLVAMLILLAKIKLPYVICRTASLVGAITTPVSMLVIGASLSFLSAKEVFGQWRIYFLTVIRLLCIPVLIWAIFRNFLTDPLMLGVLVVLAGMPGASMTTMMCFEYGGNTKMASQTVFITTLASFVSIPLLVYLLHL